MSDAAWLVAWGGLTALAAVAGFQAGRIIGWAEGHAAGWLAGRNASYALGRRDGARIERERREIRWTTESLWRRDAAARRN